MRLQPNSQRLLSQILVAEKRTRMFLKLALKWGILSAGFLLQIGCDNKPAQNSAVAPAVSIYTVASQEVGNYFEFTARTEAYQTATIITRVSGELVERGFKEGATVQKDQLLFKFDSEEYLASLNQAKADLSSKQANADNAAKNWVRGQALSEDGFISQADLDQLATTAAQAKAALKSAEAVVEKAELNLSYTEILAPFAGHIGRTNFNVGSVVTPQGPALATLTMTDPINVSFQVTEAQYLTFIQQHADRPDAVKGKIEWTLRLPNNTKHPHSGKLNFADSSIDSSMGTYALRAEFPNPQGIVLPGLFVTLVAEGKVKRNMSLIPQMAVQENQQGKFVLVVGEDNTVSSRVVVLGRRINAMWVVESGLEENESIVIEGLQKIRSGIEIKPVLKTIDPVTGTIL